MAMVTQSYVHGISDTPLIGDSIGVYFDETSRRFADQDALIVRQQNIRWSYRELNEKVDALAAGLLALGLNPGDRIGIWSPNNAEWAVAQFATAKAGLILVNINPSYRLAELDYALNKVGCKALITADSFKTSDYVGMLRELAPEIDRCVPGKLKSKRLPQLTTLIRIGDDERRGFLRFADVLGMGGDYDAKTLASLKAGLEQLPHVRIAKPPSIPNSVALYRRALQHLQLGDEGECRERERCRQRNRLYHHACDSRHARSARESGGRWLHLGERRGR